jgi:phytoene synthase
MRSEALRASREIIAVHSKSFALASRLLPPAVRDRAVVVYAWCRRADDAVDLTPPGEVEDALARLRHELEAVYAGDALDDPILDAFQTVVTQRSIPRRYPQELLEGLAMDVRGTTYTDLPELLLYCHRVAGVVGLMMCHVMGVAHEDATAHAVQLGVAMQLTNIGRDVLEDYRRGRVYLPADLLARHGCPRLDPAWDPVLPEAARRPLATATCELLDTADGYYRGGNAGIAALTWRCGLAVRTASFVYAAIGDRVRGQGGDPRAGRAWVTTRGKIALLGKAWLASTVRRGARGVRVPTREVRAEDVLPVRSASSNAEFLP